MTEIPKIPKEVTQPTEKPNETHLHNNLVREGYGKPVPGDARADKSAGVSDALFAGVDPTSYIEQLGARLAPRIAIAKNIVDPHVLQDWTSILDSMKDPRTSKDATLAQAEEIHLKLMKQLAS